MTEQSNPILEQAAAMERERAGIFNDDLLTQLQQKRDLNNKILHKAFNLPGVNKEEEVEVNNSGNTYNGLSGKVAALLGTGIALASGLGGAGLVAGLLGSGIFGQSTQQTNIEQKSMEAQEYELVIEYDEDEQRLKPR